MKTGRESNAAKDDLPVELPSTNYRETVDSTGRALKWVIARAVEEETPVVSGDDGVMAEIQGVKLICEFINIQINADHIDHS
ncbi:hypothetical protein SAY86_007469 [Trapa natans]|uniref:Uncharacterized protein n=1 Tax=Trapa natans TaxID=22666 RepID=A0AAN7R0F1_TRANT|nr:hypothetical protein SAY86_007469 [Trapa natans]